jgi:arylsulfatase A-like enzyme
MTLDRIFTLLNTIIIASLFSCNPFPQQPPNIIFLLTDDQRWDALGAAGNKIIQTPNLDQLSKNGVLFNNAFVTTSICCVSRASILTGQYASRHGINSFRTDIIGEQLQNTYPLLLKNKANYKIGFIGKYGVGLHQRPIYKYDYWACEKSLQPRYEGRDANGHYLHYTDKVQNDIFKFLDRFGKQAPFCLSVSFKAPHVQDGHPRQFIYNPRYRNLFKDVDIPLPETADSSFWNQFPDDFQVNNEARKRWQIRFPNKEKYQESVASYYRLIYGVDVVVGKLVEKLKQQGIYDNTVIIFMGDNGFYLGEHGMAGKWYPHEESIRVPFIIADPRMPKSKAGQKLNQMVLNIDVAPTILSMAGVDIPENMQGQNLIPLYNPSSKSEYNAVNDKWRSSFLYEHTINIPTIPKSFAVVNEKYKLITYPELASGFEEFYDRVNDPKEQVNLIDNPSYKELINDHKIRLEQLQQLMK